jgi:hypothetical protein
LHQSNQNLQATANTLVQLLLLTCIYSTDSKQVGLDTKVELRNGKAVLLTVPAAGFVIYE